MKHPRQAAQERQDREAPERHPRDAGRQRDERAHDRQHAGEEDGRVAVALEPAVGHLEVVLADVQPLAVLLDEVDAAVVADRVGDPRADDVRERRRPASRPTSEYSPRSTLKPAKSIVGLAGDRDAGALGRHQDEDPGQAEVADDVRGELDERVRDRGETQQLRPTMSSGAG